MKTVYILGAGCSCEDRVPLVDAFFQKMEETINDELKHHPDIKYFNQILSFKKKLFNHFNIEDFFSMIDFYISLGVKFPSYNLNLMRTRLIYLIARTIRRCLTNNYGSPNYKRFYTNSVIEGDAIISFNWDLLLDSIRSGVNYGVSFMRYDLTSGEFNDSRMDEKIKILKLHGSLNFIGCTRCKARFHTYQLKAMSILEEKRKCPICSKGDLRILLIPPTTYKNLKNYKKLQEIWSEAFNKLSYCDRIRFVGYSFPLADVEFKHLLKAALNYGNKIPEIEVYDYRTKNSDKNEFENHYNQIFREIITLEKPIIFHYTKFSGLVDYLQQV